MTLRSIALAIAAASLITLANCGQDPDAPETGANNQFLSDAGDPPRECSRRSFEKGDQYFVPSATDVHRFETTLEKALRSGHLTGEDYFAMLVRLNRALNGEPDSAPAPSLSLQHDWERRYMGVVRKGRRTIAGDFEPVETSSKPFVVRGAWGNGGICDGGPGRFGVEFDPSTGNILMIDFDGGV